MNEILIGDQRQLFFPLNDNYNSRPFSATFSTPRGRKIFFIALLSNFFLKFPNENLEGSILKLCYDEQGGQ